MYDILIIDDDAVDRRIARSALDASNIVAVVHEADSGREGLRRIMERPFDCVLLDFQLPDIDGIDLLRELEALDAARRPAVVMLTGTGNERVAVQAMKLGVQDYLVKGELEPAETEKAIRRALESHREEKARSAANSRLLELALVDNLTGVGNRNLLELRLEQALKRARRQSGTVGVMLLDLNGFKAVNDTHGHFAGDEVLKIVGKRLTQLSRDSDTVARLGGDEFVVIMETGASDQGSEVMLDRIRQVVAAPIAWSGTTLRVGASVGAAFFPDDGDTVDGLLKVADDAMYEQKRHLQSQASDDGDDLQQVAVAS